ncbi:uncharacterized protein DNG_02686 [Cephalotrichum gorgonifer]|uniref:Nitrogen regulatory protein areA GATA-like domain-containing protein n=1 Tax=Cephalotrichum gorgonifer TaxID=2041049 RepID=A0AAE8SSU6_9PEZI|nr:uncharacterized protein DNG_02686 [Cephalotrichum gorgonifer]
MDFSESMILPKGFVINSDDIYKEIASYPVVPPDKIKEYWRVYTTTFRRLIDPTANRLEHFWWHVWGSDRKHLSGKTLARLFEEISTGPTIAPLPGPPNRWEPPVFGDQPPPWERRKKSDKPSTTPDSRSTDSSTKEDVSSGKPQPQPHPILKKSRGDSRSGPRPTAHFAVPDEDDGEASSGSASTAGLEIHRASPGGKPEKRKVSTHTHKKQFHASTASKRRPALPRRISSQSSASQDPTSKDESSSSTAKPQGQRSANAGAEGTNAAATRVKSSAPVAPEKTLSSKAAGKRPAARPGLDRNTSQEVTRSAASGQHKTQVPHTRSLEDVRKQPPAAPQETSEASNGPIAAKMERVQSSEGPRQKSMARPTLPRTKSHADPPRKKPESAFTRTPRNMLVAEPTASTNTVAAQGTIIDFDRHTPRPPVDAAPEAEDPELPRKSLSSSLLDSKFVPTQPSLAPPVPLGRTRSQLTLLLEREKERRGDSSR